MPAHIRAVKSHISILKTHILHDHKRELEEDDKRLYTEQQGNHAQTLGPYTHTSHQNSFSEGSASWQHQQHGSYPDCHEWRFFSCQFLLITHWGFSEPRQQFVRRQCQLLVRCACHWCQQGQQQAGCGYPWGWGWCSSPG